MTDEERALAWRAAARAAEDRAQAAEREVLGISGEKGYS